MLRDRQKNVFVDIDSTLVLKIQNFLNCTDTFPTVINDIINTNQASFDDLKHYCALGSF